MSPVSAQLKRPHLTTSTKAAEQAPHPRAGPAQPAVVEVCGGGVLNNPAREGESFVEVLPGERSGSARRLLRRSPPIPYPIR